MATSYDRLRADVGATTATIDDTEALDIYTEAGEEYTGAASIKAKTRVIALQRITVSSAKLSSYKANNSSEDLSDVFDHLYKLLNFWQGILDKAVVDETEASGSAAAMSVRVPVVAAW